MERIDSNEDLCLDVWAEWDELGEVWELFDTFTQDNYIGTAHDLMEARRIARDWLISRGKGQ